MTWEQILRLAILQSALKLQAAFSDAGVAAVVAKARAFFQQIINVQREAIGLTLAAGE
jgi:hypothetical protein